MKETCFGSMQIWGWSPAMYALAPSSAGQWRTW